MNFRKSSINFNKSDKGILFVILTCEEDDRLKYILHIERILCIYTFQYKRIFVPTNVGNESFSNNDT